jgi:lipocalin
LQRVTCRNCCSEGGPNGALKQSTGVAVNDHPDAAPGKFRLNLEGTSSPLDGFNWIVDVGEKGDNGRYEWAILSAPLEPVLFILARDVDRFRANFEATVLDKAAGYGFTQFYNKPVPVYQSATDCAYPPLIG